MYVIISDYYLLSRYLSFFLDFGVSSYLLFFTPFIYVCLVLICFTYQQSKVLCVKFQHRRGQENWDFWLVRNHILQVLLYPGWAVLPWANPGQFWCSHVQDLQLMAKRLKYSKWQLSRVYLHFYRNQKSVYKIPSWRRLKMSSPCHADGCLTTSEPLSDQYELAISNSDCKRSKSSSQALKNNHGIIILKIHSLLSCWS